MMTGGIIVGTLLLADPDLQAFFADPSRGLDITGQIKAGRLPDDVILPALLVRTTSSTDRQPLKRSGMVKTTDRVSVTVRAGSYEDQLEVIRLVRVCCRGRTGSLAGATGVSILTNGTGPDIAGPADSFEQTQDFRVSFDEPA